MNRSRQQVTALVLAIWLVGAYGQGANRSMAVFTFDNLTGSAEHDWIGTGFAEALTAKLRNVDELIVRDRRSVSDITRVAQISQRKITEKDVAEMGRLVGSDYVIFGAVQAAGSVKNPKSALRATARLVEVRTGRISKALQLDGTMENLFRLQTQLALDFVELLQLEVSVVARNAMEQRGTDSLLAYKLYCEGLVLLDRKRYGEAMKKFREAQKRHPGILYAEAHHALGTAYLRSGKTKEMLQEFQNDVEVLSPIWFDLGLAYERAGQHEKAAEAFQTFVKYTDRRFSPWSYGAVAQPSLPEPGEGGQSILLSAPNGDFHCLDRKSGMLRWRKKIAPVSQTVTLAGGYGYFASPDGAVHSVNALTGAVRWSHKLGAAPGTAVTVGEKQVWVATQQGAVVCLDRETGKTRWQKDLSQALVQATQGAGILYIADAAGCLYAMGEEDGAILWRRAAGIEKAEADANDLYVATRDGRLMALDPKSGESRWVYSEVKESSLLESGSDGCLVRNKQGGISLVGSDGTVAWNFAPPTAPLHVATVGDRVVCAGATTELLILDRKTGRICERRQLPEPVLKLSRAGQLLLVHTKDGAVHAFGVAREGNDPDDRQGYLHLAKAFEKNQRQAEAIQTYRLILDSVDPHCAQALHALARLYRTQGKDELARQILQEAQNRR